MILGIKLIGYFLLWSLWAYCMHVLAHKKLGRFNLLWHLHRKHHAYEYGDSKWPPWHDYLFWFGHWRSSMDVYITFTIPLIALALYDPLPGCILLGVHYVYEVFLSRNVLDHNPNITGPVTAVIPIGRYHMHHHRDVHCNFAFYLTLWDHLFGTTEARVRARRDARRKRPAAVPVLSDDLRPTTGSEP